MVYQVSSMLGESERGASWGKEVRLVAKMICPRRSSRGRAWRAKAQMIGWIDGTCFIVFALSVPLNRTISR